MRHDFFERHSRRDSPVHRLPAGLKVAVALGSVLLTVLLPVTMAAVVALGLIVVVGISRLPVGDLLKRLLLVEPFVLGVAVLTLFQPDGVAKFGSIVAKSTVCLSTMIVLANTTPFAETLRVARRVRVPALLVTTIALLYRYLFVLVEETQRMQRARQARTFRPRSRRERWQMLGALAGELFVRSTERAERIYTAMCARGWR